MRHFTKYMMTGSARRSASIDTSEMSDPAREVDMEDVSCADDWGAEESWEEAAFVWIGGGRCWGGARGDSVEVDAKGKAFGESK